MNFSLIVCTYNRPAALIRLLNSVKEQTLYPAQILIVDGSQGIETSEVLKGRGYPKLQYLKVAEEDRGLTRQRNYGIKRLAEETEVVCFLDDDIILKPDYFEKLISTYRKRPDAVAVGGWIEDGTAWKKVSEEYEPVFEEFQFDDFARPLGQRNVLRKKLGLLSDKPPGVMPDFSHGFSTGFLPPSTKIYPVDYFMGGVSSYRKELFDKVSFSSFFEGYGLYEDMDFCLRASKLGELYVNTGARVAHLHEESGRPNRFKYGKMVVRNGWYVWRVQNPSPDIRARLKWHATSFLLTLIRLSNALNTDSKKEAFTESLGRLYAWWGLLLHKPGFGGNKKSLEMADVKKEPGQGRMRS